MSNTIYAMMLVLFVTIHGAPTKRQDSADEKLLSSLKSGVLLLGKIAMGPTVSLCLNYIKYFLNFAVFHFITDG